MPLTLEQQQALRDGQPVHWIEPETRLECVLVLADQFQSLGYPFDPDHSRPVAEMAGLLAELAPEDWKDAEEWRAGEKS